MQVGEEMLDCNMELNSAKLVIQNILSLEQETRRRVFGLLWVCWDARNKANSGEEISVME
jgi:hypothetical protein